MPDPKVAETVAVVFISGFAIQQALQIIDPLVVWMVRRYKDSRPNKDLPGGITESDFKKALVATLSFVLGSIIVLLTGIRLLTLIKPEYAGFIDVIVSGLVIGTGTEAVNTVLKFLGYVKDAQKPTLEVVVTISPTSVTVKQGTTFQFRAYVKNGHQNVAWSVLHGAGGSIDADGRYSAPATPGIFLVTAVSKADPSKDATATVTVTT